MKRWTATGLMSLTPPERIYLLSQHYVSITGIQVKGGLARVYFWRHAIPAMAQAKKAPGNISADAKTIDGIHHTFSIWKDEASMRAYLTAGAHKKAMKIFKSIGTGRTYGFLTDQPLDWEAALKLWRDKSKNV